jgi:hypothetical protein
MGVSAPSVGNVQIEPKCLTDARCAYFAFTAGRRKVTHSYNAAISAIGTLKNEIEQGAFLILKISTQCIAAQIGDLDHAGKFAVHKQRRINNVSYVGPQSSGLMKLLHHLSMLFCDRFVVIVD